MDQEPLPSSETSLPEWETITVNEQEALILDAKAPDSEGITPSVLVIQGKDGKWTVGTDIKRTDDDGFVEPIPSFFSERNGYPAFSSQAEAQKSAEQLLALFTPDVNRYDIKLALMYDAASHRWEVGQDKIDSE